MITYSDMNRTVLAIVIVSVAVLIGLVTTAAAGGAVSISAPDEVAADGTFDFEVEMESSAVGEVAVQTEGVTLELLDDGGDSLGAETETSVELIDPGADDSTYSFQVELDGVSAGTEVELVATSGDEIGGDDVRDRESTSVTLAEESADDGPGDGGDGDDGDSRSLELLVESEVDHDHACTHGDHDTRTPLDAGASPDSGPVVDEDHVIWAVTYEGSEGYVTYDSDAHDIYPGLDSWVFYKADGSVDPVDATVTDSGGVPACDTLDSYIEVETPADGEITLELTGGVGDSDPSLDPPETESDDIRPEATIDFEPGAPSVGENVTLTAGNSTGGVGDIVDYEWTVGDEELTGEEVTATVETPGETEIELTVENEHGETDTVTETITVSSASGTFFEVVEIDVPETAPAGSVLDVTATVANAGANNGTVTITHAFDGEAQADVTKEIPAGGTESVDFSVVAPDSAGEYHHTVSTDDDETSVQTAVETANETNESGDVADDTGESDDTGDDSIPGFTLVLTGGAILVACVQFVRRRWSADVGEEY